MNKNVEEEEEEINTTITATHMAHGTNAYMKHIFHENVAVCC